MATSTTNGNSASAAPPRGLERISALDPSTTTEKLVSILERDGAVIVQNLISRELAEAIRLGLVFLAVAMTR